MSIIPFYIEVDDNDDLHQVRIEQKLHEVCAFVVAFATEDITLEGCEIRLKHENKM